MPDRSSKKKPRDINQLAAAIVDEATREDEPETRLCTETPTCTGTLRRVDGAWSLHKKG